MGKKAAEVRDRTQMQEGTQKTSSHILDMIALKGKVAKPGPGPLPCDDYEPEGKVLRMRHDWSLYDLPFEDLEKAYATLRTALPKNGWKITSDGPDESKAKTPTMRANSPDEDFAVELQLMDNRSEKDPTSVLAVTVVSRCFQSAPAASSTP